MDLLKVVQLTAECTNSGLQGSKREGQDIQVLIARLEEPIEIFARRYPERRSAIMPALYLAQAEYGYLSREVMEAVAEVLQVSPVQVYEIATFYSMFHTTPVGRHHLQVCTNVSCMLLGAERLLAHIEQALDLKAGESSPDGLFTLSCVECLGSCDTAPVMQVNNEPYCENLSEQRIDGILQALREEQVRTD